MLRRLAAVVLVAVLVAPTPAAVAATTTDDTIDRTTTLYRTPSNPGEIAVRISFALPSRVRSLTTSVPSDATVVETNGFRQTDTATYEWDGDTATPSVTFTMPANRTTAGAHAFRSRFRASDGYSFVDTGQWAIVAVPQFATEWTYVGDLVTFTSSVHVDGAGATGGEIAYLGSKETYTVTAHGQEFDLVVPTPADLHESPDAILASLTSASDTLRVGERDERVFLVAAPTSVPWAAAGLEYGGSDAWVRASAPLDDPRNVWLHEYVHTRQGYNPTTSARWTIEGGAEYYAALLTLKQGRIGYPEFRNHLQRGTNDPYDSAVLTNPETWASGAVYLKGALVYGAVDRQIRLATNQTRSMQAVLSAMNRDTNGVTASDFLAYVENAGGERVREYAYRYTATSATPDTWSAAAHSRAFSEVPARITYAVASTSVHGPYRNETLPARPTLVTGETFRATVAVANTGEAAGRYNTTLVLDDAVVEVRSGTLDAGASTTVRLPHTFNTPGTYTVTVAGQTYGVTVKQPATPQVAAVSVDQHTVAPGANVTATITVRNPADRPAAGTIPVLLDGTRVAVLDPTLAAGESATYTVTATLSAPGDHVFAAGDETATVTVESRQTTTTTTTTTPASTPGFGVGTAVAGLLIVALIRGSR